MGARAHAMLRLRGREGTVRADLAWPAADPAATLVFLGDAHGELICRVLGDDLGAITLSAGHPTTQDAVTLLEWAADHAGELDRDNPFARRVAGAAAAQQLGELAAASRALTPLGPVNSFERST
jgi:hypothetical protein